MELLETLARRSPDDRPLALAAAVGRRKIGNMERDTGCAGEAIATLKETKDALGKLVAADPAPATRFQFAAAANDLGRLQFEFGRMSEALPLLQESLDVWKSLESASPSDPSIRRELARCLNDLGNVSFQSAKPRPALDYLRQGRAVAIAAPRRPC